MLAPYGTANGSVLFAGEPIEGLSHRRQTAEIGFVMQDPEMQIATDKVYHELAFGLESLGVDQASMRIRTCEMANFFGIQNWFNMQTASLSGGQKQLLCLASVMVMQPRLLLLDEPTSQLDPIAAGEFFDTLKRINRELGTTIIITEHRTENLFPIVDRVVMMREGGVFYNGEPRGCAKIAENEPAFAAALPTAMSVYARTCLGDDAPAPLTVREGMLYLKGRLSGAPATGGKLPTGKKAAERRAKPVVSMRGAWYRYERNSPDILRGASLDVYPGELYCLIGGNGAGKTTALMTASGLYRPYRGKVLFDGKPIHSLRESELYGKNIAVLQQNPLLGFTRDSIKEELEAAAKRHKLTAERVAEIVELMELEAILDSNPYDVSGGELQRAAIAKLLLPRPRVLFLDEATKGMDAFFKAKFGQLLKKLCALGTAIVLVSHDIEFCAEFADRAAMFFDGGVIAEGTPREVLGENSFYTTAAARIARGLIPGALTAADIVSAIEGGEGKN